MKTLKWYLYLYFGFKLEMPKIQTSGALFGRPTCAWTAIYFNAFGRQIFRIGFDPNVGWGSKHSILFFSFWFIPNSKSPRIKISWLPKSFRIWADGRNTNQWSFLKKVGV